MRRAIPALLATLVAFPARAAAPGATAPAPAALPALARCNGTPFTPAPLEPWARPRKVSFTTALGAANHAVQDVLATPGRPATLRAKLTYGTVSKDLEGERVRAFVDACTGWKSLGDFETDGEGRVAVPVPPTLAPGVHEVRLQVLGDGTLAAGRIWILPPGTRIAVTDIDGTLTTADDELVKDVAADLFQPILAGRTVPAYPGAAALTTALARRGYVVLYLTGRPYWLSARTRDWLATGGFAAGPLHVTDSNAEAVPNAAGVGAFKLAYLRSLAAAGFAVEEAYGNATTDVSAYAGAGVPPAATWIIGPNGGASGTNGVAASWEARAAAVSALPAVTQPFTVPAR